MRPAHARRCAASSRCSAKTGCRDHIPRSVEALGRQRMKPINVGLLGMGTVGRGVWTVLQRNAEEIARRAGRPIRIRWIATRTLDKAREAARGDKHVNLTNEPEIVVNHPDVDIVLELIGGVDAARSLVLSAIGNGKHVITANKALL